MQVSSKNDLSGETVFISAADWSPAHSPSYALWQGPSSARMNLEFWKGKDTFW